MVSQAFKTKDMTKYTSIEGSKEVVKTVFTHVVLDDKSIDESSCNPNDYDNVKYIDGNKDYGDVFIVWDDGCKEEWTLYFGKKGDEFK